MLITVASTKGGVGKTTSAIHIACCLSQDNSTLLIDGDPNKSSLKWASRGSLPFKVVDLMQSPRHTKNYEHIVFDTAARPGKEDLEALVEGCDLLIIPCSPDILAIEATLETVDLLESLDCDRNRYRILLTIVPPTRKTGEQAREALSEYPIFRKSIREYAAYEKAALAGVPVYESRDPKARIAWSDYSAIGKEILG
ncbi:ParA family protein [Leptolyngbya sp. FACHB-17]|uniref:ParA family protein n=1 Tax=unclassified Leptolyngbya TaxID=2650499 RepID=UPI001039B233|nr:ParA family protein [Leptolyngbya sp. FACHB-17]MBD2079065.1 ParA family protein [Leptolyngbya sp. FACHB-17]